MKPLGAGKIPIPLLQRTVLRMAGAPSGDVVLGGKAGVDFGAVRVGDKYLLTSSDPVTGVSKRIGSYAVHVNANDVATSGNRPRYLESVILLPEGSGEDALEEIAEDVDGAARDVGASILGGHTEVTPGLRHPIVVMTAFAVAERFVSSAMAEAGDSIMMTKTAGVEGTAALAGSPGPAGKVPARVRDRALGFIDRLSVVEEAVRGYDTGHVGAMHDCTEGGVLGAVYEMSVASQVGFRLNRGAVPVAPETEALCGALGADPLKLIGSGSLLMSVKKAKEDAVEDALEGTCRVTRVGEFTRRGRVLVEGGRRTAVPGAPEDELWRLLRRRRV